MSVTETGGDREVVTDTTRIGIGGEVAHETERETEIEGAADLGIVRVAVNHLSGVANLLPKGIHSLL